MGLVRRLILGALRALPGRAARRRHLADSTAALPPVGAVRRVSTVGAAQCTVLGAAQDAARGSVEREAAPPRVLVLGVYLADRANSAEHLVERFAASPGLVVEQRWMALGGRAPDGPLGAATVQATNDPTPKFTLVNRLLRPGDLDAFDYIVVCDDDIHVPHGFLAALIGHQQALDFAVAGPARSWNSHFDHAFSLRRPWLRARQTRFVECGPLVSFGRDAARLLLPFDEAGAMWGFDFVWPEVIGRHDLAMGIVDALPIDHSLRGQAAAYDKSGEEEAMARYLAATPHLSMDEAFTVIRRYRRGSETGG